MNPQTSEFLSKPTRRLRIIRFTVCALLPPVLGALPVVGVFGWEATRLDWELVSFFLTIIGVSFVVMGFQSLIYGALMEFSIRLIACRSVASKRRCLFAISVLLGGVSGSTLIAAGFPDRNWQAALIMVAWGGTVGALVGAFISLKLTPELRSHNIPG